MTTVDQTSRTSPTTSSAPGQSADSALPTRYTTGFDEGDPARRDLLGGKGAGLAEMTQAGLRVPPGFVVTTPACAAYLADRTLPDGLLAEVRERLRGIEEATGSVFAPADGDERPPLLLSVRSGAPVSMPGMMDTILDLGLTPQAAQTLARGSGDLRFVGDLVARFHRMYADTVLGEELDPDAAAAVDACVGSLPGGPGDDSLSGRDVYERLWRQCAEALAELTDELVPVDPVEQLAGAVEAVFRSWNTRRARTYRDFHGISHDMGTAVVVQAMVFGNLSDDSGSGVCFTRNPVTGEPGLYGEFLARAQGEDVVAGTRTPTPISEARASLPAVFAELEQTAAELERSRGDVLDIEFTVERSALYLLQVRSAKRTPEAAVRIAVDLLHEGLTDERAALGMVTPEQLRQVQVPGFDPSEVDTARAAGRLLTTGTGACPGQVSGVVVLDPDRAKELAGSGTPVVLARAITSPTDLHGMIAARGIVTATGGSTSHAAVVARALGRPCVVGAGELVVDERARTITVRSAGSERVLAEGDRVSIDGSSGEVFAGTFTTTSPAAVHDGLLELTTTAAAVSGSQVWARVTTGDEALLAREAGAHGVVASAGALVAAAGAAAALDEALQRAASPGRSTLDAVEEALAAAVAPLLTAGLPLHLLAAGAHDSAGRIEVEGGPVTGRFPEPVLALQAPALLAAQWRGLARAAAGAPGAAAVRLVVSGVSDPGEVAALAELERSAPVAAAPDVGVVVGLSTPRGAAGAAGVVGSDAAWVDLVALQAHVLGVPPSVLVTSEPLDGYLQAGLLTTDPRTSPDPLVGQLVSSAVAAATASGAALGVLAHGAPSPQTAAALHRAGVRRWAVDVAEVRPTTLLLAQVTT